MLRLRTADGPRPRVVESQFNYLPEYVDDQTAMPLDPLNMPLGDRSYVGREMPAVLEAVLPGRWGRRVANRLHRIDEEDVVGLIGILSGVRVEHACLAMAAELGIPVSRSRTLRVGKRDVLAVERWDVIDGFPCRHLVSMRTLLGRDNGSYDDMAAVIRRMVPDEQQSSACADLFAQMCLNIGLNNTDDHLRNFTMLYDVNADAWALSPAYDLVPSDMLVSYHQLNFGCYTVPPSGAQLVAYGHKAFGLSKAVAGDIIKRCGRLLEQWEEFFLDHGVEERDIIQLRGLIQDRITGSKPGPSAPAPR